MKRINQLIAVLLALVLTFSCLPMAHAEEPLAPFTAQAESELYGLDPQTVSAYADDAQVTAIVLLEGEPTASAAEPTRAAARLARQHTNLRSALRQNRVAYTEQFDYTVLLNGMAVTAAYGDLEKIARLPGVASVHVANTYNPPEASVQMDSSNEMTGAARFQKAGYTGAGTVIAVLDTGITPQHEAFAVYEGRLPELAITEETAETAIEQLGYGTYLSDKVPFSYDYADQDDDATDDTSGHGTHVSAIAAGYARTEDGEVLFCGSAPDAQILAMKVFPSGQAGTNSAIYYKALEDAYSLGADVINMSLGSYSGFSYDADLENEVFGNIYETLTDKGVALIIAAGNEGSIADFAANKAGPGYVTADYVDYGTVGAPSTYAANLSVASAENAAYPISMLTAGDREIRYFDATGSRFYTTLAGLDEAEFAVVPGVGTEEDFAGLMVEGRIALISRGEISFQEKADNARRAGAVAMLVYNNEDGVIRMSLEDRELPAASISREDGEYLISLAETVQPPEPEPLTEVRFENWGWMRLGADSVLVFDAFDAALSTQPDGEGFAAQPVTILLDTIEEDGDIYEIPYILTDEPERLSFFATDDEDGNTMLVSADGGYLTAADDGGLFLSEEYTPWGAWHTEDVLDDSDPENFVRIGSYFYIVTEEEAELYLCYRDGVVTCGTLDETKRDEFLIQQFFDPTEPDYGPAPIPTDIGKLSVSKTQQIEQSETGWQMSSFSSWGTTPDLGFKPQLTAIGGNVYAASYGSENGYELMSGTSMATPDLSGILADLLQYLKQTDPALSGKALIDRAEAMLESAARILTDADGAAYSPRKQGAGLVDLDSATAIKAYISEPLLALGESKDGVYTLNFTVQSIGEAVSYRIDTGVMTDKLVALDTGLYNSLQSEPLTAEDFSVTTDAENDVISVPAGGAVNVTVTLTLSDAAKTRFAETFPNGNFIEGFIELTERNDFRFDDVQNEQSFYFAPVYWAYNHNPQITAGISNTTFVPNGDATRAQVVTFLWRAAGKPEPTSGSHPFTDVTDGAYYTEPILWAVEQGITKGTSETTFSPDKTCSRGEFVTFLYRMAGSPAVGDTANPFDDAAAGAYYYTAVLWAVKQGITAGTSETTFSPDKTCTRGEIVTFLYRYLAEVEEAPAAPGSAIHASFMGFYGDWSKAPILEAVDWRDVIDAIRAYSETGEMDYGEYEINTEVNMAFTINGAMLEFGMVYGGYAGDNTLGEVPYRDSHIAIGRDGLFDTLYCSPMLLRNARRVIVTVTDLSTGLPVWAETSEYVSKAIYDAERGGWLSSCPFLYKGTDMDGNPLPNGTKLRVDFYAELAYGEDKLGEIPYEELAEKAADHRVWSIPLAIDSELPTFDDVSYDLENNTLTVTVSDNQYLASLRMGQTEPETGAMALAALEVFSDEAEHTAHTVVLENIAADGCTLIISDYAGNTRSLRVVPGEGAFVPVTLHCADGSQPEDGFSDMLVAAGTSVTLPEVNTYYLGNIPFAGWTTEPIEGTVTEEELESSGLADRLTPAGQPVPITAPADFYAVYQTEISDPNVLLQLMREMPYEWRGTVAIGNLDRLDEARTSSFFLDGSGGKTPFTSEFDDEEWVTSLRGATDDILFEIEETRDPESIFYCYAVRSRATGKYLAVKDGALTFVEEEEYDAHWYLSYSEENETVGLLTLDETRMLVYDSEAGEFGIIALDDFDPARHSLSFYVPVPIASVYFTDTAAIMK